MKKNLLAFVFLSIIVVSLISCNKAMYSYRESTARYVEPLRVGFLTPITADMQISQEKIFYSDTIENTLNKKNIQQILLAEKRGEEPSLVLNWKKFVMASALKKYNADDIISPVFSINTTDDFSGIIITLSGNPATYINYRKATQDDVNLIVPLLEDKKAINATGSILLYQPNK